ncbi:MAG: hypothetical protein ACYS9V_12345 [Planctomycetota bacterium]|jgi:hypothetical protein
MMKEEITNIDMLTARQRLVSAIWDLEEESPVIAAVVEMWVRKISSPDSKKEQKIKVLARPLIHHFRGFLQSLHQPFAPEEHKCDVLFIPISKRSNYLSACELVVNALIEEDRKVTVGVVDLGKSYWRRAESKSNDRVVNYILSLNNGSVRRFFKVADNILLLASTRLKKNSLLSDWFLRNRSQLKRELAVVLKKIEYIRKWLEWIGCKIVITMNEQNTTGSIFVTAAKLNGLQCHQILHGTPARLYWPFVSDQTWVWGNVSKQALIEYGAPEDRLPVIGNLEITEALRNLSRQKKDSPAFNKARKRNFLFLAQIHGRRLYKAEGFKNVFNWLKEVFSGLDKSWHITVRMHPSDGKDEERLVRNKLGFLGNRLHFSEPGTVLIEDAKKADFACSCSSTAVLVPLVIGVPCSLVWSEDMNRLFGKPFLEERFVARTPQQLSEIINIWQDKRVSKDIIATMLDNIETADKVAAKHVLDCLQNL